MRRFVFLLLAVVVLTCVTCVAADNGAVGKWNCVSDDGHGAVLNWLLQVNESGGKLSGALEEAGATMPLIDPVLDGKSFTFKTFINKNCTVKYEVKIEGNKFEGTFECPEVSGTLKGVKQK
jgi:hypothetical protein